VPSTPAIGRKTGLASAPRLLERLQDGRKRKRHKGFRACRALAKFRIIHVILISPDGPLAKPGSSTWPGGSWGMWVMWVVMALPGVGVLPLVLSEGVLVGVCVSGLW